MANSPLVKRKVGTQDLSPFHVGLTEGKSLKGVPYKHTHYVLIDKAVAAALGIKAKAISKPGGADILVKGNILQTNRKNSRGNQKPITARRPITRSSRSITAYLQDKVATKDKKLVDESYSIGFPSSVPLKLIIKFFKANCPKVVRISTGKNFYQIKAI